MDIYYILGWGDMEAVKMLDSLGILPNKDPFSDSTADDFDIAEFAVSDNGIEYIEDELNLFNEKNGTQLVWKVFEPIRGDYSYFLIYQLLSCDSLGDVGEEPFQVQTYSICEIINLIKKFKLLCGKLSINDYSKPDLHIITDLSIFYSKYQYDSESIESDVLN